MAHNSGQRRMAEALISFTAPAAIASASVFAEGIAEFVGSDATEFRIDVITGGTVVAGGVLPFVTRVAGSDPYRVYVVFPSTITGGDVIKLNVAGIDWRNNLLQSYDTVGGIKYDGDRIDQIIPGADLVTGAGDELGGPIIPPNVTPPPGMGGQRYLTIYEQNPNGGSFYALNPANATGIPIPAFRPVAAVPVTGQLKGEAVLNTTNGTSWIWDGTRWNPIVPPSIVPYPTDADVLADNAAAPGTYAFSRGTGNLFVRFNDSSNDVWRQIGIRHFTDVAQLQASAVVDGSFGYVRNGGTFWIYKNSRWQIISTVIDTEVALLALDPGIYSGAIGIAIDTGRVYMCDGGVWLGQPFRDYATEAALLADTPSNGTMAVAIDTGMVLYRAAGAWVSINRYATPVGAADPAAVASARGDLFYNTADQVAKVYDGGVWQAIGSPSQWAIGSIQQSILTHAQFTAALPASERGKWKIAIGQDITGTALATITGQNKLPDLRGAYFRMAGQNASNAAWNGGNLGAFEEDKTARPDNQFTTNNTGNHQHYSGKSENYNDTNVFKYGKRDLGSNGWVGANTSPFRQGLARTDSNGQHMHAVNGGGDPETRPKTYSVNYFVKTD